MGLGGSLLPKFKQNVTVSQFSLVDRQNFSDTIFDRFSPFYVFKSYMAVFWVPWCSASNCTTQSIKAKERWHSLQKWLYKTWNNDLSNPYKVHIQTKKLVFLSTLDPQMDLAEDSPSCPWCWAPSVSIVISVIHIIAALFSRAPSYGPFVQHDIKCLSLAAWQNLWAAVL